MPRCEVTGARLQMLLRLERTTAVRDSRETTQAAHVEGCSDHLLPVLLDRLFDLLEYRSRTWVDILQAVGSCDASAWKQRVIRQDLELPAAGGTGRESAVTKVPLLWQRISPGVRLSNEELGACGKAVCLNRRRRIACSPGRPNPADHQDQISHPRGYQRLLLLMSSGGTHCRRKIWEQKRLTKREHRPQRAIKQARDQNESRSA